MTDIEEWIEDSFVDMMDICQKAVGREETTKLSRVWGSIRNVALAALAYEGLLGEGTESHHSSKSQEDLRQSCLAVVERLEENALNSQGERSPGSD